MTETTIKAPAGWIPETAIAFVDPVLGATVVDKTNPLPVQLMAPAASSVPLAGTASGTVDAGPFVPTAGQPITVALGGAWAGRVQLLRSTDGGVTRLPLTPAGVLVGIMTASGVDQPWAETEPGATFFLAIAVSSGTVSYRVSQ